MSKESKDNRNRVKGAKIDLGPQEAEFWIGSLVSGKTLEPVYAIHSLSGLGASLSVAAAWSHAGLPGSGCGLLRLRSV